MKTWYLRIGVVSSLILTLFIYQNCSPDGVTFNELGSLGVCDTVSCELTPLTYKAAVSTILIALGDEVDSQVVVKGSSAQLIAETVVRYSTPKSNPKILLVQDHASGEESAEDLLYVKDVLLSRYDVTFLEELETGLKSDDLKGFDLIWFNNPGRPMGSEATKLALLNFEGGVVLQGDDLARGDGFNLESLTGLEFVDNGVSVKCGDVSYPHDNNTGEKFRVTLDPKNVPGANDSTIYFEYGNDIDNTVIKRNDLQVFAYAQGGPSECVEKRPAIVRYIK